VAPRIARNKGPIDPVAKLRDRGSAVPTVISRPVEKGRIESEAMFGACGRAKILVLAFQAIGFCDLPIERKLDRMW